MPESSDLDEVLYPVGSKENTVPELERLLSSRGVTENEKLKQSHLNDQKMLTINYFGNIQDSLIG